MGQEPVEEEVGGVGPQQDAGAGGAQGGQQAGGEVPQGALGQRQVLRGVADQGEGEAGGRQPGDRGPLGEGVAGGQAEEPPRGVVEGRGVLGKRRGGEVAPRSPTLLPAAWGTRVPGEPAGAGGARVGVPNV